RSDCALAFAAWAALSVVLSPVSLDYHYSLVLPSIAIVLAYWRDTRPARAFSLVVAAAIVLIGAPLPYKSPMLSVGGWALLAYPKLYGALLIWAAALYGLGQNQKAEH